MKYSRIKRRLAQLGKIFNRNILRTAIRILLMNESVRSLIRGFRKQRLEYVSRLKEILEKNIKSTRKNDMFIANKVISILTMEEENFKNEEIEWYL